MPYTSKSLLSFCCCLTFDLPKLIIKGSKLTIEVMKAEKASHYVIIMHLPKIFDPFFRETKWHRVYKSFALNLFSLWNPLQQLTFRYNIIAICLTVETPNILQFSGKAQVELNIKAC